MSNPIHDKLDRPLQDLRISVIDRCNFRCPYCMPEQEYAKRYNFLKNDEWLSYDEIVRLAKLSTQLGVQKIRLTGGEPLLRPNIDQLIKQLSQIKNITDLAMTTNGALLEEHAAKLKDAGLNRITVSLDALSPEIFKTMTGQKGDIHQILDAITTAEQVGFDCIKINVVIQKGVNDHQIMDLVRYFRGKKSILRFIEYMDVGTCNRWDPKHVFSAKAILDIINTYYPLRPLKANYYGEVASRYAFEDGKGEVGFIPSVTQPFCRSCTRARLSTDGKIYNCLFASEGTDLRLHMRNGASDQNILNILKNTWGNREDRYSELRMQLQEKNTQKIEMFHIGG